MLYIEQKLSIQQFKKAEKCRERRRGLSVEGDDERARRREEEEGRWREREKTVVSGHIRHIENTL